MGWTSPGGIDVPWWLVLKHRYRGERPWEKLASSAWIWPKSVAFRTCRCDHADDWNNHAARRLTALRDREHSTDFCVPGGHMAVRSHHADDCRINHVCAEPCYGTARAVTVRSSIFPLFRQRSFTSGDGVGG